MGGWRPSALPCGTCYSCPGGEDHLKRRSSSPPVPLSPWLPALSPVEKQKPLVAQVPPPAQARGCKGRSPLHKITFNPPLPAGKGAGGMGAETKLKAGAAGDQNRRAPRRVPVRQGYPATTPLHPPPGSCNAGLTSAAWVQARGCKGRSPLHKITFSPPLPAGKGVGGMGARK